MTSEIRANKQTNRAGLGTVTYADTGIIVSGIVTCTELSGLTALNIAGVGTASTLDINGDIDVDGHTNLDNVSVAGVSTFSNKIQVGTGVTITPAGAGFYAGIVTATSYRGDGSQLTGISAGVAGIDTTGQSHLKLLNVNAGVVTFTNTSNPIPSSTLPSGTGGHLYSFDNALNIVGGAGVGGNGGLVFKEGGFSRWRIASGHFRPHSDSTVDIGTNTVRVRNIYADTLYGDGSNLSNLPASAPVGGASTNTVFFENDKAVAVNYQITSTKNAMSAGPITINAGIAVTVPSGCSWTIV